MSKEANMYVQFAAENPYDGVKPNSPAALAANAVVKELCGRGGFDDMFENFDDALKRDIITSLTDVVEAAHNPQVHADLNITFGEE